jgi:hypothetical protein
VTLIIVALVEEDVLHLGGRYLARYPMLHLGRRYLAYVGCSSDICILYPVSYGCRALRTYVMEDILYPVYYGCRALRTYVMDVGLRISCLKVFLRLPMLWVTFDLGVCLVCSWRHVALTMMPVFWCDGV